MSNEYGEFKNVELIQQPPKDVPQKRLATDGLEIPVASIQSIEVAETGHNTQVNLYYPEGEGPFPVVVFIHGGGFFTGFNKMDEPVIRQLCHDAGCAVISPNYVLAPQHQWPDALNELYTVIRYFVQHAEEYRFDVTRMAIGGSSAGGNLAAALCVKSHREQEFEFKYAALVYPALDLTPDFNRVNALTDIQAMPPEGMIQLNKMYIPENEDPRNPLISPIYADPTIFPPTSIYSGRLDLLMEEQRVFANRLVEAGVDVLYRCYQNTHHGFNEIAGNEYVSRDCRKLMALEIKRVLAS